jgi:hypothetical protein
MSTTTQHTPGPWYSQPTAGHETHGQCAIASEATGKTVAIAYHGQIDARLIAAAPMLLELVEQAYDRFTDNDFMPPNDKLNLWLEKAESFFIITAATGGAK